MGALSVVGSACRRRGSREHHEFWCWRIVPRQTVAAGSTQRRHGASEKHREPRSALLRSATGQTVLVLPENPRPAPVSCQLIGTPGEGGSGGCVEEGSSRTGRPAWDKRKKPKLLPPSGIVPRRPGHGTAPWRRAQRGANLRPLGDCVEILPSEGATGTAGYVRASGLSAGPGGRFGEHNVAETIV